MPETSEEEPPTEQEEEDEEERDWCSFLLRSEGDPAKEGLLFAFAFVALLLVRLRLASLCCCAQLIEGEGGSMVAVSHC